MRAIGFYRYLPIEDPESLVDLEIATPIPAGRDLLVKVHAVSVNPADVKVRAPKPQVEQAPRIRPHGQNPSNGLKSTEPPLP